jgi:hypothetical protein
MAPSPPTSRPWRILAAVGAAVLVLGGVVFWWQGRSPVDPEAVASYLDRTVGGGRVRFSDARVSATPLENGDLQLAVEASATALAPLYSKRDAGDYLQRSFSVDPEQTAEARRVEAEKDASLKPELARLRPFPPDPYRATVLQLTGKPGDRFIYRATLTARRADTGLSFAPVSAAFAGPGPVGELRAVFAEPTYVAGDAGDDARLRAVVADFQAFAGRVDEVERNMEAVHDAAVRVRRDALMVRLSPGTVYRGTALRSGDSQGTPLYLEITSFNAGGALTALLRNSGGWHYARPFQGTWLADAEFESVVLDLNSPPELAVRHGGAFLENTQPWSLALHLDPKGNLAGSGRSFDYRFQSLDPSQLAPLQESLSAEYTSAEKATAQGALFQGSAVGRQTGATENVLLRFGVRAGDGETFQASLESPTRSWRRPLTGLVIGNSRRSEGSPIRLSSDAGSAVSDAPADSALGDRSDLEIRLGFDGQILSGQDDRYSYRLTPVGSGELSKLDAAKASRAERFASVVKEGAAFDGTIRDDQGSVTQARLEIGHVDSEKGTVVISIHSLALLFVFQDFAGTWSAADGSMTVATSGQGDYDFSDNLAVPFFVAPVPHTVRLALNGSSISGGIKGDTHWTIEFPVGVFLAAPREAAEGETPPGPVLPAFPETAGAYALVDGAWKALPRNNGHVIVEKSHAPMSDDEVDGGPLGLVSAGVRRMTEKGKNTPYLEFDGREPVPECSPSAVVLLVKGPAARSLPGLELAQMAAGKEGKRRVQVVGAPPSSPKFGEQRVAAYTRHAGPEAVLFTATSSLPSGIYALNADVAYEVGVR